MKLLNNIKLNHGYHSYLMEKTMPLKPHKTLPYLALSFLLTSCGDGGGSSSTTATLSLSSQENTVFLSDQENEFTITVNNSNTSTSSEIQTEIKHISGPLFNQSIELTGNTVTAIITPETVSLSEILSFELTVTNNSQTVSETFSIPVANTKQIKSVSTSNLSKGNSTTRHNCSPDETLSQIEKFGFEEVYSELPIAYITELKKAPGDSDSWYALSQGEKKLKRFKFNDNEIQVEDVLSFGGYLGWPYGFAFHPDFSNNGKIYTHTYTPEHDNEMAVIREFTWSNSLNRFDLESEVEIFRTSSPEGEIENRDHQGGTMHFGPDGYLYIAFGDFTRPESFNNAAQEMSSFAGKMLRIDINGNTPYGIPNDNPFVGQDGAEIYALGFRHPWKWSFDRETGDIWLGDVGWVTKEEINKITAGGNYGWPIYEGSGFCPGCPQKNTNHGWDLNSMIPPIHEYGIAEEGPQKSVTGGFIYRGSEIPSLYGKYIFGDFIHGKIWALSQSEDQYTKELIATLPIGISTFAEDHNGELYAVDIYTSDVYKLVNTTTNSLFREKLSDTGCVDVLDPLTPPAGAIPFDVQVPLWSDATEKMRWLFLPENTQIGDLNTADGDLDYPIGTVMVKHFQLNGNMIETRLLTRLSTGNWEGYSYEWNTDLTDADLLDDAKDKQIDDQVWTYPSRSQCLQCHTEAAGRSLGPTIAQLNTFHDSESGVVSQLDELIALNIFDFELDKTIQLPYLENENASLESKARAYLDSNCSGCHRPGAGAGRAEIDLRATTPFPETGLCDATPNVDNIGIEDGKLIVPGDVDKSILAARISTREAHKMPLIGSNVVHDEGVQLISDWIESLSSCN